MPPRVVISQGGSSGCMAKVPAKVVGNRHVHAIAWSQDGLDPAGPLLAVALEGSQVLVLKDDGDHFEEVSISRREQDCDCYHLSWSPSTAQGGLLAMGWADGSVQIWGLKDRQTREDAEQHAGHAISVLQWSPDGEKLITADGRPSGATQDDVAILAVWKVQRGRPSVICPYRRSAVGGYTHAVFRTAGKVKKMVTSVFAAAECPPFYCGGELGTICCGNDKGNCNDVITGLGAAIAALLYDHASDTLFVITRLNMLAQYKLTENKPVQLSKVKLNMGKDGLQDAVWAGVGHLAIVSADHLVRVNHVPADEHYVLSPADSAEVEQHGQQHLLALSYEPNGGVLTAGTREGLALIWRRSFANAGANADSMEHSWEALPPVKLPSQPLSFAWGPKEGQLAARCDSGLWLMPETVLRRLMWDQWALVQLSANTVQLEHAAGSVMQIDADMRICGAALHDGTLALWSGSLVKVYSFVTSGRGQPSLLSSFECRVRTATAWGESLFLCVGDRIEVTNLHGNLTQTLALSEAEGAPVTVHAAGNTKGSYLAVGTDRGYIKAWDISRRDPRQHTPGKRLLEETPSRVTSVQVTSDGLRMSATMELQHGAPPPASRATPNSKSAAPVPWSQSTQLWVYLTDSDAVQQIDFAEQGRMPSRHFWDAVETKLIAVETRPAPGAPQAAIAVPLEVTTIFSTPDHGLKMQNAFSMEKELEALISMQVPRFYFSSVVAAASEDEKTPKRESGDEADGHLRLSSRVMREFVGMEDVDEATQHALIDFSYYLTVGNMDEAHRAVKLVKNAAVWESMARMCVKTKRLDVAEMCLGNMGHARGARAVREVVSEQTDEDGKLREPDVCAAVVAVQLGLIDEAKALYEACGRHDLLNQLLQASGEWEAALQMAHTKDRIHLKTTHYAYARQLEAAGNTEEAIGHFEKSGTHRTEVPRMLFDASQTPRLQQYVDKTGDAELLKWWAQFAESNGQFDKALQYYERAEDQLAIVRVLCFHGQLERATEVVNSSGDAAAAYHLARQLESNDNIKESIFFYQRAGRFNHAVRLAKEHDMASELTMLALQAPPQLMVEVAQYFESRNMPEKAVSLYQKGGNTSKALDLCFRCRLFDSLREIADSLSTSTGADPALLQRCADFFLDHGQYEKSVHLFIIAGEVTRALDLCVLHTISISEEMAERMCPSLGERGAEDEQARHALLAKVAKCCKRQGNYHLACKKYTQAGDKLKAMKCLLKSGDTEKIIFFAGVSRSRDIYILAANYLQNLDWHSDAEVMKSIVTFYTKAKAFEQLSAFYDACAQVEIDEYRDYEKAVGALREALAYLGKARAQGKEHKTAQLQAKITHVENFVNARKMVKSEPQRMIELCHELLEQQGVENAIRMGDVYALMMEWYYSQRQMQEAYALVERMRAHSIILSPYLDHEMVQAIYDAMGMPVATDPQPPPQQQHDIDQIAEHIEEDGIDDD